MDGPLVGHSVGFLKNTGISNCSKVTSSAQSKQTAESKQIADMTKISIFHTYQLCIVSVRPILQVHIKVNKQHGFL